MISMKRCPVTYAHSSVLTRQWIRAEWYDPHFWLLLQEKNFILVRGSLGNFSYYYMYY
jgi:hypothetical protein